MKKNNTSLVLALTLICTMFPYNTKAQSTNLSEPIPGQYIIKFKDSSDTNTNIDKLEKKLNTKAIHVFEKAFKGASISIPPGQEKKLEELSSELEIEEIAQDFTIYASAKPPMGGGVQVIPKGINWIDAELNTTNEGSGVTIAVLDTGIDFDHPDLMVNIPLSRDFSGDNTGGDDNNFTTSKGHGTHVAGVIAALNNNTGVLGVGSLIDLISVKVLRASGSGSFSGVIAGLDYVTSNSNIIGVANLSLGAVGGTNPSQSFLNTSMLLQEAVQRAVNAGVIVVVAAGNESVNVTSSHAIPAMYPEAVSVSALSDSDGLQGNDSWASFSNFGTEVDIIAPGVSILSTSNDGKTSSLSGTSFSAPHVAGTIGLYLSRNGRPANGNAQLIGSILNAVSMSRSLLPGEPSDGVVEPSCYANGASLI